MISDGDKDFFIGETSGETPLGRPQVSSDTGNNWWLPCGARPGPSRPSDPTGFSVLPRHDGGSPGVGRICDALRTVSCWHSLARSG